MVSGFGVCQDIRGQTCSTPNSSNLTIVASSKLLLNININFDLKNNSIRQNYVPIDYLHNPSRSHSDTHVISLPAAPLNVGKCRGLTLAWVTKVATRPHPIIIDDLGAEVSLGRPHYPPSLPAFSILSSEDVYLNIYIYSSLHAILIICSHFQSELSFGRKSA